MCTFIKNVYLLRCNLFNFIYYKIGIMIYRTISIKKYIIKNVYFCVILQIVLPIMKPNYERYQITKVHIFKKNCVQILQSKNRENFRKKNFPKSFLFF